MIKIVAENIRKQFSKRRVIFSDVNFSLESGNSLSITGSNGSGKSSLIKIIAGISSPSAGKVRYISENQELLNNLWNSYYGLVAPYLNLYEEFSPLELLVLCNQLRGVSYNEKFYLKLIEEVGLEDRANDPIKDFSSGMKQRIKLLTALCHNPSILLLDEPFSNLDEQGIITFKKMITSFQKTNGILIVATNDEEEKLLCNDNLHLLIDKN